MLACVADLGNSRLKWGRLGHEHRLEVTIALPLDDQGAWDAAWHDWGLSSEASAWTIATVNPPLAERLSTFLTERGVVHTTWYRSAAEVPLRHELEHAGTAGADRALAVLAALALHDGAGPGFVVSCGTAITVERIASAGIWQGGAIAPGLGPSAQALHRLTAQLPLVDPDPGAAPASWGRSTRPALEAGLFWGTIGAIRELLARQSAGLAPPPWIVWTGGDAPLLAPWIDWPNAQVVPDLVLEGLARLAASSPAVTGHSTQHPSDTTR